MWVGWYVENSVSWLFRIGYSKLVVIYKGVKCERVRAKYQGTFCVKFIMKIHNCALTFVVYYIIIVETPHQRSANLYAGNTINLNPQNKNPGFSPCVIQKPSDSLHLHQHNSTTSDQPITSLRCSLLSRSQLTKEQRLQRN